MADEGFSFKKFFLSFFEAVPWIKNIRFILGMVIILAVAITVWRAFFMKVPAQAQAQTQTCKVYPFSFSTVSFTPQAAPQSQKQEIKKRPWWLPVLFVEGYGFKEADNLNGRQGVGCRAGGRLEW